MFHVINECTRRESLILNTEEIVNNIMFTVYQFHFFFSHQHLNEIPSNNEEKALQKNANEIIIQHRI